MLSCKQRQLTIAASNVVGSHKHLRHCAAASDVHEGVLHLIPIRCTGMQQPVEHSTRTVLTVLPRFWRRAAIRSRKLETLGTP